MQEVERERGRKEGQGRKGGGGLLQPTEVREKGNE